MSDFASYELQNFIPFSADIYSRLLERIGEAFWPLHLLTVAMGAAALLLALKSRGRLACLLLAPLWAFVAYTFFIQRYAELNWAGNYVGYMFIAEAVMFLFITLTGVGPDKVLRNNKQPSVVIGVFIALAGLVGWPFIGLLTGGSWYQAEVFGIHADPTVVTTLGLGLMMLRGWVLWLSVIIPLLWLVVSALTLLVLDAPGAVALSAVLASGLVGLVWRSVASLSGR